MVEVKVGFTWFIRRKIELRDVNIKDEMKMASKWLHIYTWTQHATFHDAVDVHVLKLKAVFHFNRIVAKRSVFHCFVTTQAELI